ncbi:hypothetical protein HYFRA_00005115 [Hymenoscyphus fraxineus]|uniref:SCP domain-containing protein n=1 Tax=Hymenoscyphus fraxineus TaxID=746836 RepID=A0A9N9LD58_9HELO|nr:hypothetical protein HYFRA_00005115 [Hymenoscyphus fraxineus]
MQITNLFTLALGATLVAAAPVAQENEVTKRSSDPTFIKDMLTYHNFFRKQHGAKDLVWDQKLADFGQSDSDKCAQKHSNGPYGENKAWGTALDTKTAVNMWGSERTKFNFNNGGFSMATGHFTQVVWKETTTVGCGLTKCGGSIGNLITCEYEAFGNMEGAYRKQVGAIIAPAKLTDKIA